MKIKENKGLGGAKRELQLIVGRRSVVPVFSELTGDGPTTLAPIGKEGDHTIVKWVGVRVMAVNLKGKKNRRCFNSYA